MTESLTTASFDTLAALLRARSGLIIGKDKIYTQLRSEPENPWAR
jgi:hypothetical protein